MGGGGAHMFMWGSRGNGDKKRPSIAVYRRLLRFVRPYRWNLALAAVLLVISTALGLVWPQVVRQVLDLGLKEPGLLDSLVVVLIVVLLVRAALDGVRSFVMAWTGEKVIFDLRMAIVMHLQSLSLSFFNQRKTGDLMSHVTSDATLVHGIVTQTIIQVLGQVLTLVGGVAVIFVMNWRLALLTLVVAPPIGLIGQYLGRRIRDVSRAAQDAQGEAVGVLQEAIAEVRVVQAFTREEYEAKRFHEKLMVMFQKSIERSRIGSIMFPAIGFLGFASSIVVLWYGGHQVAAGEITAGELVAFLHGGGRARVRHRAQREGGAGPVHRCRRPRRMASGLCPRRADRSEGVRRGGSDLRAARHGPRGEGPSRRDGARSGPRRDRVRGRLVPVRRRSARLRRSFDPVRGGADHRSGGAIGRGQDDHGEPGRPFLRSDRRSHRRRWTGHPGRHDPVPPGADRVRAAGADPVR